MAHLTMLILVLCALSALANVDEKSSSSTEYPTPPMVFPSDSKKYTIVQNYTKPPYEFPKTYIMVEQPPLVFPDDETKFKIIPRNSTIVETLNHAANNPKKDSLTMIPHEYVGYWVLVLFVVIVVVSAVAYLAIFLSKTRTEYRNRHILINEEDGVQDAKRSHITFTNR